jgi:hypothetical protein
MNEFSKYWLLVFILCCIQGIIAYDVIFAVRTKKWGTAIVIVSALIAAFGIVYYFA